MVTRITPPKQTRRLKIQLKRAYDPPSPTDGPRVLVDRVWPRGVTRERLALDAWMRDLGPTEALRKWFHHDAANWDEFRRRYLRELRGKDTLLDALAGLARGGKLTLVYGARDPLHNQAVVIGEALRRRSAGRARRPRSLRRAGAAPTPEVR